jgi:DNA-binding transcriptional MerR regulator
MPADQYLTTEEVAARYRTSTSTVHAWAYKRTGPPSMRVGKRRLYRLTDLIAWEAERLDTPVEAGGAA